MRGYIIVKRILDILLSLIALILLSPLLIFVAIIIKIDSKGPVLFKQERYGKDKRIFNMYKFRTMRTDCPKAVPTRMLNNPEMYITRLGSFLRRTSIDELPQLFNVLAGQMSIIGPRPVIIQEADQIAEREKYGANSVKPGMSGWAQVNGRDLLTVEAKAQFDGYYVKNMSLMFDIKIMLKTFQYVLARKDIVEGRRVSTVYEVRDVEKVQPASEEANVKM